MTNRMPTPPDARTVIVGVDTHKHVHVAVAIDSWGTRRLTGVSRTWLSQNPGPPNLARETITRTPAATLPPARLTSPAPRP